jgi:hypothetical protein
MTYAVLETLPFPRSARRLSGYTGVASVPSSPGDDAPAYKANGLLRRCTA